MKNKFTILGCGSSLGSPWITGHWGNCNRNDIKNIREYSISDTYEEIIDELGIGSTKFAEKIDLSKIDRDDPNLSEALKANAVADLIIVLGEARLSYNNVINSNNEFKRSFENFLTFNS